MVQSSKELVRNLFQHKSLTRVPFIPWVCRFAAQLEQVSVRDMLSDPGTLSSALLNTQQLFSYDAIINTFDSTLEAEACGCEIEWGGDSDLPKVVSHPLAASSPSITLHTVDFEKRGRIPTVLDATRRLTVVRGKQVAIVGVVTGPLTLAKHLRGDSFISGFNQGSDEAAKVILIAADVSLNMSRVYCALGVDAIVIADEMLGQIRPDRIQTLAGPMRTIWNVTRYFGVSSLVLSKGCNAEQIEPILDLQADGIALSGNFDTAQLRDSAMKQNACWARTIPEAVLQNSTAGGFELPSAGERGGFLTTDWEVPYDTDVDAMHLVIRLAQGN